MFNLILKNPVLHGIVLKHMTIKALLLGIFLVMVQSPPSPPVVIFCQMRYLTLHDEKDTVKLTEFTSSDKNPLEYQRFDFLFDGSTMIVSGKSKYRRVAMTTTGWSLYQGGYTTYLIDEARRTAHGLLAHTDYPDVEHMKSIQPTVSNWTMFCN